MRSTGGKSGQRGSNFGSRRREIPVTHLQLVDDITEMIVFITSVNTVILFPKL